MHTSPLKILVLAGGPDREREVSLESGSAIAQALRNTGHDVRLSDIGPDDLACLDAFDQWQGDVIFPALHGAWGEGGPLQTILQQRQTAGRHRFAFVGCRSEAASLCMDKYRTKVAVEKAGIRTAPFELLREDEPCSLQPPLVVKAPYEGSSVDLVICKTPEAVTAARKVLFPRHAQLLFEQFIPGRELTVGILGDRACEAGYRDLPPIQIIPAVDFYDYDAKYKRNDTQYRFDIDLPAAVLESIAHDARRAFAVLGCRDLARVDFLVDPDHRSWLLEVNTLPGFTSHSLLPMAAARAGLPMEQLVDHLVKLAAGRLE